MTWNIRRSTKGYCLNTACLRRLDQFFEQSDNVSQTTVHQLFAHFRNSATFIQLFTQIECEGDGQEDSEPETKHLNRLFSSAKFYFYRACRFHPAICTTPGATWRTYTTRFRKSTPAYCESRKFRPNSGGFQCQRGVHFPSNIEDCEPPFLIYRRLFWRFKRRSLVLYELGNPAKHFHFYLILPVLLFKLWQPKRLWESIQPAEVPYSAARIIHRFLSSGGSERWTNVTNISPISWCMHWGRITSLSDL